jgi:3-methyladenine DNA glycosylase Tag
MSRSVFRAGFNWRVIEAKWPGFEAAFHGFDPPLNAAMSEDEFDAHLKDNRIVRNAQKIAAVRANAQFLVDLAREHGSAARFFADWPDSGFVGLIEVMKRRAARCAGETAMRFFRNMGKPAFITTRDVSAALIEAGVLEKPPKNRKDFAAVQAAFNAWSAETGRDLTALSRVLAMSAGPIYEAGQVRPGQ